MKRPLTSCEHVPTEATVKRPPDKVIYGAFTLQPGLGPAPSDRPWCGLAHLHRLPTWTRLESEVSRHYRRKRVICLLYLQTKALCSRQQMTLSRAKPYSGAQPIAARVRPWTAQRKLTILISGQKFSPVETPPLSAVIIDRQRNDSVLPVS